MQELLETYFGNNPFILHLKKKNTLLNKFEEEYLNRNFRYCGYSFVNISLEVGRRNNEYLNSQFGTQKEFDKIFVDFIYGETSEIYHFGYKKNNFFVYKNDCEDPFKKEISLVPFDSEKYSGKNNTLNRSILPHQIEGIKFMKLRNPAFNWDDMGLGKTTQAIVTALDCGYKNVLVVTLASLKLNWRREINIFNEDAKIVSGSIFDETPSKFTIINYEILKNFITVKKTKNGKNSNKLLEQKFDCIILDEIHRARNPTSIQSNCIKLLCSQTNIKKIIGLSGTPFERNIDFYNICRSINQNITDVVLVDAWFKDIAEKYKEYALTYCNAYEQVIDTPKSKYNKEQILNQLPDVIKKHPRVKTLLNIIDQNGYKGKIWQINNKAITGLNTQECDAIVRAGYEDKRKKVLVLGKKIGDKKIENINSEELNQRIKHTQIIRKKQDVLDSFPTKFVFPLYYELSPKEKIKYRDLWAEYLAEQPEAIEKQDDMQIISQSIKMREFFAKMKVTHTTNFVENKIADGLKVIVFTHFKEEYDMFTEHFGDQCVGINASMTAQKKQDLIDKFQNNENVKVIIGNIKTLGTGHNLTKGDIAIINSPDWNSGEHEQAEGRSWRIGRTEDVIVYYCLFEGTHEEEVYLRSTQKQENKNIIMKS
jgi:SNF2 family DNA or RNA helicase